MDKAPQRIQLDKMFTPDMMFHLLGCARPVTRSVHKTYSITLARKRITGQQYAGETIAQRTGLRQYTFSEGNRVDIRPYFLSSSVHCVKRYGILYGASPDGMRLAADLDGSLSFNNLHM